ncbi:MAG: hypothetical protein WBA67_11165 [Jannaschia sp.]
MRARFLLPCLVVMSAMAACAPPLPESGAPGIGFETPDQYAARREAQLTTGVRTPPTVRPPATPPAGALSPQINTAAVTPPPASEAEQLASETRAILGSPAPLPTSGAPLPDAAASTPFESPVNTAAVDLSRDNPGISQEQDFGAVSAERTIQDDAARVNAARQQYQIVQPTELERPQDNGPNIIAYAIERARPVGESGAYRRPALASERRSAQKCQGYRTADVAQEEFLSAGGPDRDRLNLDPDGDGNACGWNPATFRNLVRQ